MRPFPPHVEKQVKRTMPRKIPVIPMPFSSGRDSYSDETLSLAAEAALVARGMFLAEVCVLWKRTYLVALDFG